MLLRLRQWYFALSVYRLKNSGFIKALKQRLSGTNSLYGLACIGLFSKPPSLSPFFSILAVVVSHIRGKAA